MSEHTFHHTASAGADPAAPVFSDKQEDAPSAGISAGPSAAAGSASPDPAAAPSSGAAPEPEAALSHGAVPVSAISSSRESAAGTPSVTLADEIYHDLRNQICRLELTPGTKLSEAALARQYSCSRIPVREAVRLLAAEGALEVFPQRGSFVSRIDMAQVERTRYLREVLETRVVLDDFDKGLLFTLVPLLRSGLTEQENFIAYNEYGRLTDADTAFHNLFYQIDGKEFVMRHTGSSDVHYIRARRFALGLERSDSRRNDDSANIVSQHRRIVDAIENRDRAALAQELVHHFRNINTTLLESDDYRKYQEYFRN